MNKMNHGRGHNILILTLLSLIFGFLALLFAPSSLSPIYQGLDFGHNDLDGNFFLYLGYGYTHGLKPYVDLFDHKGMYIFWIEGLGALMGGKNGMFVIMSLYMCANFFCYNLIFREMGYEKTVSCLLLPLRDFPQGFPFYPAHRKRPCLWGSLFSFSFIG